MKRRNFLAGLFVIPAAIKSLASVNPCNFSFKNTDPKCGPNIEIASYEIKQKFNSFYVDKDGNISAMINIYPWGDVKLKLSAKTLKQAGVKDGDFVEYDYGDSKTTMYYYSLLDG
jgi:hypothetical protein